MSDGTDLRDLLDAWVDGGDEARTAALAERIRSRLRASPKDRRTYWRWMEVHAGLRRALAVGEGRRSGRRSRIMHLAWMRIPSRPWRWAALAAGLAAVVTIAIVAGLGNGDTGRVLQADLRSGIRHVASGDTRLSLAGEAVDLRLAADGALTAWSEPAGMRVALERGRLQVVAEARPVDRPLRVVTPDAEVRVIGTAFTVGAGGHTTLTVSHGEVQFTAAGLTITVAAGGQAVALREGPVPVATGPVICDGREAADFWRSNGGTIARRTDAAGCWDAGCWSLRSTAAADEWPWLLHDFPAALRTDWRGWTGIEVIARAPTSTHLSLELALRTKGGATRDPDERYTTPLILAGDGAWQRVRLPFDAFRRKRVQISGTPVTGFSLTLVTGISLLFPSGTMTACDIDRMALYR